MFQLRVYSGSGGFDGVDGVAAADNAAATSAAVGVPFLSGGADGGADAIGVLAGDGDGERRRLVEGLSLKE